MIKIDVFAGFLGSGKTTLIKKILRSFQNEKVVIIENEFGEIGIDGDWIKKEGFDVIELQNGCICCSIKLNFKEALQSIIHDFKPNRIIIEPTGIGMLSEIINLLNDPNIKDQTEMNSLTTIVDGINYFDYVDTFGYFFQDQIENAATIIVSKTQCLDGIKINEIINSLREMNPKAYIITEPWDELTPEETVQLLYGDVLLDVKVPTNYTLEKEMKEIKSVSIKTHKIFTEEDIRNILDKFPTGNFGRIIRAKGSLIGGKGSLEFNYINGNYAINISESKELGKLCIIGKEVNVKNIREVFQ